MQATKPQDLQSALEHLSVCLHTPCIPGEMEQWAQDVAEAMPLARPFLRRQLDGNHRDHYAGILEQDGEMYRDVLHLKQEDQRLLQDFDALTERVRKLVPRAARVEPDEARLHEELDNFVKDTLEFLVRWEKQEIALRSWLQEAFTRDRGVGD